MHLDPRSWFARVARRWFYAAPVAIVAAWLILLNHLAPPPRAMDAAEPSVDDRARILNADDRLPVANTTDMPWRTVGQIRAWWGTLGFTGTGVLVAPDQVLTAAHCVYRADLGGWAGAVTFTPARANAAEPYGTASAIRYALPREYAERQNEAHDIVLITLDQPIGNETGWLRVIGVADAGESASATLHSAGYPADKSGKMYAVSGSITSAATGPDDPWEINLDATFGQSGSPIWIDAAADSQPTVVAVLVAELDSGRANLAAPVTAELLDQLRGSQQATASIAQATGDAGEVLVAEPGDADSSLIAMPIAGCGAGILPAAACCCVGLTGLRNRRRIA